MTKRGKIERNKQAVSMQFNTFFVSTECTGLCFLCPEDDFDLPKADFGFKVV